ncbi:hypothetical protein K439DRAFT_1616525 [Ramaria rubella]|nr:hypothetical protein K439DRAFT_1616525 [Ramaria rubella]
MWPVNPDIFNEQDYGPSLHSSTVPAAPSTYPAPVGSSPRLAKLRTESSDATFVPTDTPGSDGMGEASDCESKAGHEDGVPSDMGASHSEFTHTRVHTPFVAHQQGGLMDPGTSTTPTLRTLRGRSLSMAVSSSHRQMTQSMSSTLAQRAFLLPKNLSHTSMTSFTSSTSMSNATCTGLEEKLRHMEKQLHNTQTLITHLTGQCECSEVSEEATGSHATLRTLEVADMREQLVEHKCKTKWQCVNTGSGTRLLTAPQAEAAFREQEAEHAAKQAEEAATQAEEAATQAEEAATQAEEATTQAEEAATQAEEAAKQAQNESTERACELQRAQNTILKVYDAPLATYKRKKNMKNITATFTLPQMGTILELFTRFPGTFGKQSPAPSQPPLLWALCHTPGLLPPCCWA